MLEYQGNFYGIGQGLFACGSLKNNNSSCLNYMYDCGTETSQQLLKESIEEARWMKREELKLFFSNTYPNLIELLENYLQKSSEKI